MAFVIESSQNQPLIRINMLEPVEKADGLRMKICLGQLLSSRPKNKTVYLALCLGDFQEDGLQLVQILSNFAEIYHQWRKYFHLQMLVQIDENQASIARQFSKRFVVPMAFFSADEDLEFFFEQQLEDTQPFRPEWTNLFSAQND